MNHQHDYTASIDTEAGLSINKPDPPPTYTPFPVELLPEPLRSMATEGADALQCDPVLIVLPMLATVGAAIGNARRLTVKSGWHVAPCLWTMFVAESGTVKTPAFRLAKTPLEEIERDANHRFDADDERYEAAHAEYLSAKKAWEKEKEKQGNAPSPPAEPIPERFIVKDTTLAALVEILRDNPRGLLVPTDELAGWFGSFNKHDQGGGDAQHWISIYSGESISVDRKGNRNQRNVIRPIKVYSPFVSITGAIQPGLWHQVLTPEHQASGMAARFLMAWPSRRAKVWSEDEVSESTLREYARVIGQLARLDHEADEHGRYQSRYIGMAYGAKRLWSAFYNRHNSEHIDRSGSLAAASAKIEEVPARLGLILHCVRMATGDVITDQLDADTMQTAIAIANWFMVEAERIYGVMASESQTRQQRELSEWIRLRGGSVTARDVVRGRRQYRSSDEADQALSELVRLGWGEWISDPPTTAGGRPTRMFALSTVDETPAIPEKTSGYVDNDKNEPKTRRVAI